MHPDATRSIRLVHPPTGPSCRQPDDPGTEARSAIRADAKAIDRALIGMFLRGLAIGAALVLFVVLLVVRGRL